MWKSLRRESCKECTLKSHLPIKRRDKVFVRFWQIILTQKNIKNLNHLCFQKLSFTSDVHLEGSDIRMSDEHRYLPSFPDHDIVVVTISDAQDVSSYTVAGAGQRKLFYCLIEFVSGERRYEKQPGSGTCGSVFIALINHATWNPTNTPTQPQGWFPPRCPMKYAQEKEEFLWAMNDWIFFLSNRSWGGLNEFKQPVMPVWNTEVSLHRRHLSLAAWCPCRQGRDTMIHQIES